MNITTGKQPFLLTNEQFQPLPPNIARSLHQSGGHIQSERNIVTFQNWIGLLEVVAVAIVKRKGRKSSFIFGLHDPGTGFIQRYDFNATALQQTDG